MSTIYRDFQTKNTDTYPAKNKLYCLRYFNLASYEQD